jgi:hypothetical protein
MYTFIQDEANARYDSRLREADQRRLAREARRANAKPRWVRSIRTHRAPAVATP